MQTLYDPDSEPAALAAADDDVMMIPDPGKMAREDKRRDVGML